MLYFKIKEVLKFTCGCNTFKKSKLFFIISNL